MDIKILEETETRMRFIIEKVNPAIANSLRRVLLSDIPKMAVEDVEFHLGSIRDEDGREYESISPLFDEIVSHRLGMLPIPTDMSLYKFPGDCDCAGEGCPSCTIMYTLNKKGPCTVYSGDLEPLGDRTLNIKEDLIPIVKLSNRQALLVYATAVLGTGRVHAKWQVVTCCGYKYYPVVEVNRDECDLCGLCVSACPKKIFAYENGKLKIDKDLALECNLCNACIEVCGQAVDGSGKRKEKILPLTVKGDDTKFVFVFETDGAISARDTLDKGLELLEEKFGAFRDLISELE
jgi:DNA-directed RNA polymerase subunit D